MTTPNSAPLTHGELLLFAALLTRHGGASSPDSINDASHALTTLRRDHAGDRCPGVKPEAAERLKQLLSWDGGRSGALALADIAALGEFIGREFPEVRTGEMTADAAKRLLAQGQAAKDELAAVRKALGGFMACKAGMTAKDMADAVARDIDKGGAAWMGATPNLTMGSRWKTVEEMIGDLAARLEKAQQVHEADLERLVDTLRAEFATITPGNTARTVPDLHDVLAYLCQQRHELKAELVKAQQNIADREHAVRAARGQRDAAEAAIEEALALVNFPEERIEGDKGPLVGFMRAAINERTRARNGWHAQQAKVAELTKVHEADIERFGHQHDAHKAELAKLTRERDEAVLLASTLRAERDRVRARADRAEAERDGLRDRIRLHGDPVELAEANAVFGKFRASVAQSLGMPSDARLGDIVTVAKLVNESNLGVRLYIAESERDAAQAELARLRTEPRDGEGAQAAEVLAAAIPPGYERVEPSRPGRFAVGNRSEVFESTTSLADAIRMCRDTLAHRRGKTAP